MNDNRPSHPRAHAAGRACGKALMAICIFGGGAYALKLLNDLMHWIF